MNLAKLIKGLQKEMAPLVEERGKVGSKIDALECKYNNLFDAIQALRDAEAKLQEIEEGDNG